MSSETTRLDPSSTNSKPNLPPGLRDIKRRSITNNVNKDTATWDVYGAETNGEYAKATILIQPGGGVPFHLHHSYAETFRALDDDLTVMVGDSQVITLKPGEAATAPIGVKHRFFNDTDHNVTFEGIMRPAHEGFERSLYILYGLANDGLTNEGALPKSFVHLCCVTHMGDFSFPGTFGFFMNPITKLVAWYARWSGVEGELTRRYWD